MQHRGGVRLKRLPVNPWSCCNGSLDHVLLKHHAFFMSILDIIGICKSYEDATKITVKSNNREISKRNIYLMDMSGKVVSATLWGEDVSTCIEQSVHVHSSGDIKRCGGGCLVL